MPCDDLVKVLPVLAPVFAALLGAWALLKSHERAALHRLKTEQHLKLLEMAHEAISTITATATDSEEFLGDVFASLGYATLVGGRWLGLGTARIDQQMKSRPLATRMW